MENRFDTFSGVIFSFLLKSVQMIACLAGSDLANFFISLILLGSLIQYVVICAKNPNVIEGNYE